MDWKECQDKKFVKNIGIDLNLIKALLKQSANKEYSTTVLELNEKTASSKVSLAYDSLREILEALAIKKGYKIYNHECYCAFLKEILKDSSSGDRFDEFRKIRNAINYYGEDLTPPEAESILLQIENLKAKIKKYLT